MQSMDPPERERVLINIDETSVRLVPEEGRGHVSKRAYRLFVSGVPMGRRASLAACRSCVTHVAAICNKKTFQELLPQVVLVGENQVTEARLATLRSAAPERCHIWRYKTGWMTAAIMVEYVRLLGRSLKDFQSSHRFILYFDALRAHIHPNVLRAASRAGLWVCVIPGKLTWALQPCDTHLFASYKRILGQEVQRRSGMTAAGELSWELVLGAVWHIVRVLIDAKDWSHSFSAVGIADAQEKISARTKGKLRIEPTALAVGRSLPTLSDLTYIFPKGAIIPIQDLFLPVERFLRGIPVQDVPAIDTPPPAHVPQAGVRSPWFGRTRSTSALASRDILPSTPPPAQPCPSSTMPLPPLPQPPTSPSPVETAAAAMVTSVSLPPPRPLRLPVGRPLTLPRRQPSHLQDSSQDPAPTSHASTTKQ